MMKKKLTESVIKYVNHALSRYKDWMSIQLNANDYALENHVICYT